MKDKEAVKSLEGQLRESTQEKVREREREADGDEER